jgi:glycosyltransferase involved in cell wall biosynthesis
VGNTNNYAFVIASQLRELGCEVVLYIDAPPGDLLNRPENYSPAAPYPYPGWIIEKPSLTKSLHVYFPNLFEKEVIRNLNTCDAVILNYFAHRYKNFLKPSVISISMFSGTDLEVMADYDSVFKMQSNSPKLRRLPSFIRKKLARFSVNQVRKGIEKASLVSYFPEGLVPAGDKLLKEIFRDKPYNRFNHIHVNTDGHHYSPPPDNKVFRIFSLTRFMWKLPFPPGRSEAENKGNDIMLKGIALFLTTCNKPVDIHFVEKGLHVKETKELIEELGFSHMVTWHQVMPFKDLNEHIRKADVVFEQLGTHYISGGFYAMLQGRPVIGNARPEVFDVITGEKTPVCHATTPEEVCSWLQKLSSDKSLAEDIGKRSRQYILDHFDVQNETRYFKEFIEKKIAAR